MYFIFSVVLFASAFISGITVPETIGTLFASGLFAIADAIYNHKS